MNRMPLLTALLLGALALSVAPANAKEWARKMFDATDHDFGTIARGSKAEFLFELQNIYKEEVHISGVRSNCGCTTPTIVKSNLKTWEKGAILAKFNSRSFLGQRSATITVTIDRPYSAEVQLTVKGYIRSDVVLQPGSVNLGEADAGTEVSRTIDVNYAGRDTWRITNVELPNDYVRVSLRETRRERMPKGDWRIGYQMNVRLTKDAPIGYLTEQFFIVTNDQRMQKIPVTMNGRVLPSVSVSPSSLALGVLGPGEKVTKRIIVRSKKPFKVTDVDCGNDCLSFVSPEGAKTLHMIPVTFTAGDEPGTLAMEIKIKTDLGDGAIALCVATASVRHSSSR